MANRCPACGSEIARTLLSCPGCGRLVYADELSSLAARASDAANPTEALTSWRKALDLLPADSVQHQSIQAKIDTLSRETMSTPVFKKTSVKGLAAGAGSIALL